MDNRTLAARLANKAHILEKERASLFRIRAYRRAAETVLGLDAPIEQLLEEGGPKKLADLPGIGKGISRLIEALLRTPPAPP